MSNENRFDKVIARLANSMNERIDRTALALRADKAPGQKTIPEHQQVQQYLTMDDNGWNQVIQKHGLLGALKYRQEMEKKVQSLHKRVQGHIQQATVPGDPSIPLPDYTPTPMPQALLTALQQMGQQPQQPAQQQQMAPTAPPMPTSGGPGGAPQ